MFDLTFSRIFKYFRDYFYLEILVCKPNPCQNGGKCSIVTAIEYSCNCTSTGHTGKNCEKLLFTNSPVPKQPIDATSQPISMTSYPKKKATLNFYAENTDIVLAPSMLTFLKWRNDFKFSVRSNRTGLFWVTFDGRSEVCWFFNLTYCQLLYFSIFSPSQMALYLKLLFISNFSLS